MRNYNPKECLACKTLYVPTGNCAKFCAECQDFRTKVKAKLIRLGRTERQGMQAGVGSGAKEGHCHSQKYRRWFLMDLWRSVGGFCEGCGTYCEPKDAIMHHKDHDRNNNVYSNFELMCKRCHQIEHKCWLNFSKP